MWNIFKKKEIVYPFSETDNLFFRKVIKKLPEQYSYLYSQVNEKFILGYKPNILNFKNRYTFILSADLENKYKNKTLPTYFIIQGIKIWNNKYSSYFELELDIVTGFLGGFKIEDINFNNYNIDDIDLSNLHEKHFENEDRKELIKIIGNIQSDNLDLESTYKITLPEGDFYVIKNLDDGDSLAVDKDGKVYELRHDPYQVTKISNSLNEYLRTRS